MGALGVGLHCCSQAHRLGKPVLVDRSSLLEGEGLIAVELGTEKRTHLVEQTTKARSRGAMFESAHGLILLFDSSMILLQMVIQVALSAMFYLTPENIAYGAWVSVVAIRGDCGAVVRYHAGACPGGTEEGLSRCQVAGVAEAHVHQIPNQSNTEDG
jgi:hypothetical protein